MTSLAVRVTQGTVVRSLGGEEPLLPLGEGAHSLVLMTSGLPNPVSAPDGRTYLVRTYRSGTFARFPSAHNTPRPGGALVAPLFLLGWLLHLTVYRRCWTVEATPWHNVPGARHRERAKSQGVASARAAALRAEIALGAWSRSPHSATAASG
jgi:hypothetical protein